MIDTPHVARAADVHGVPDRAFLAQVRDVAGGTANRPGNLVAGEEGAAWKEGVSEHGEKQQFLLLGIDAR